MLSLYIKCLSILLELIANYAKNIGLSREDISNLDINEILKLKN